MEKSVFYELAKSIEKNPFGIPKKEDEISQAFIDFLKLIYTEEEAGLVRYLNTYPFFMTAQQVAKASGKDINDVKRILDGIHAKYALMGRGEKDQHAIPTIFYLLNYHHRYPEIKEGDLEAANLYLEFFIKEEFYKRYEATDAGTPVFRTIPVQRSFEETQEVLTSEEAYDRIDNLQTDDIALVPCPCRTRTEKLGTRECKDKFPIGACIIPGDNGKKFVELGMGKAVTKEETKKYMDEMQEYGLVIASDNALSPDPVVICLCCGCCCSQLRGRTKWDNPDAVQPSNFIPRAGDDCVMCGVCVKRCFVDALTIDEEAGKCVVDQDRCIGCGVCTLKCPQETLKLYRVERKRQPFKTSMELGVAMFKENKK